MHDSSYEKMAAFVQVHLDAHRGTHLDVLDFGSQTVDAQPRSYRTLIDDASWSYRGLDIEPGQNVDIVVADPYCWNEVEPESVDLVISGQAIEHVEFVWASTFEIVRVLKPGGLAVLIAPSAGPEHRYPVDCWRFYTDGFRALASYVDGEVVDVFTDWDRAVWADSLLVLRRPEWDDDARGRFAERLLHQRALTTTATATTPALGSSEPSVLASVTSGALTTELQRLRDDHLARDAAAAAAAAEVASAPSVPPVAPPGAVAATYGRIRARIAAIAGPSGRSAYKRLRGRS